MGRFEEVPDGYDPAAVEQRVFEHWRETSAYERTKEHRADGEPFFFVDGPPYTSGSAHMGHAWNKGLKDAYIRYHRMNGHHVTDRPGYDMHGLPIETKVEEELGFENKKDIEEFGMESFIEECRKFAEASLDDLQSDFVDMGVWMDWDDPYKTVTPEYMEATWWGFKQVHERGLVEQGKRSIRQCPRCETAIAKNEVEYHEVEDPSIYVTFPLVDREGSLVIWTTTPWTIPANTFVAVDGDVTYQRVRAERDGETEDLWLAEACVEDVLKRGRYEDYEVVESVTGSEMTGWRYEHPLAEEVPDHPDGEGALQVHTTDYVEVDRTGLVHSAPGHGEEDFAAGTDLGLEIVCPVGGDGVYTETAGKYAGKFVRDANEEIRADLDAKGYMLADETYVHDYGQCWRCDTDIVQIVTDQWFITVTDIKGALLENIEDSEWYPGEARDRRFREFVEESPDWNVSRQRYWGVPIPIWQCDTEDCDHLNVVGDREELADRVNQGVDPEAVDLHRPTVDDLTMDCAACGATAGRVPDVFDVWLDSSVASWGTLDYPGNGEAFDEAWPADLIVEAHDQTRGWFWSQLGMGTAALDEIPYRQVLMHGHALDEDRRKMSKSVGNVVTPDEIIERQGRDVMRLFLLSANPQGDDIPVSWDEMADVRRDLDTLWNVFRFPLPYMELDGYDPVDHDVDEFADALRPVDRWVLSRLQTVETEMDEEWDRFRQDRALSTLLEFVVEDVSRYYVKAVRERMWDESDSTDKRAAYQTLYRVLREVVALLAPYAPFVADELYTSLEGEAGHPTVHMCDWPTPDGAYHDPDLERAVASLRGVERAGLNARETAGRKLRWPVERVVVSVGDAVVADAVREHRDLLADQLNARTIDLVDADEEWGELVYSARADMAELGPAFGGSAQEVMRALNEARVAEPTLDALETAVADVLDGESLSKSMVEFVAETPDDVAGSGVEVDGETHGVVYVDATLTEDVESEGYARDVIRRVQRLRKDLDLDIDREIGLAVGVDDETVAGYVDDHRDLIAREVRAAEFGDVGEGATHRTVEIEGVTVELAVEPLAEAAA